MDFSEEEEFECTFKYSRNYYLTYYMTDLVLFYVIPLAISCYLYICIGSVLFPRHRKSNKKDDNTIHLEIRNGLAARTQVSPHFST